MAFLEDKIDEIRDPELRRTILQEVKKLKSEKKFGLVFEEHIPELAPIYNAAIRPGDTVAQKTGALTDTYSVTHVEGYSATLIKDADGSEYQMFLDELVVVKRFGEAIYPALTSVGQVETDPAAPYHTLIEADNYHALQLLEYAYAGKVDVIYIDPPYNTGARDWKYNNRYVDSNDSWRHSKWLAMMRKRLLLAKRLLKPDTGVLIVTIDEHEVHHLGVLLEQVYPEAFRQMVTIVITPGGITQERFSRVEEYALFCFNKEAFPVFYHDDLLSADVSITTPSTQSLWQSLLRRGVGSRREDRLGMFFPINIDPQKEIIISIGDALPQGQEPDWNLAAAGVVAWPVRSNGSLGRWRIGPDSARKLLASGYLKLGGYDKKRKTWTVLYLQKKTLADIDSGILKITGRDNVTGAVELCYAEGFNQLRPIKTVWNRSIHHAGSHGSTLLRNIFEEGSKFSFPKSVYATRDAIAAIIRDRTNALVLDFFAGSGTTLHATLLLNAADGGNRQCILVTNNEVAEAEAKRLSAQGYRPNDPEWEAQGICRSVTFPRCKYVIQGRRDDGTELAGEYLTGRTVTREKPRTFRQLGFIDPVTLTTAARKKEVVSLIEGIPETGITADTAFFVSDKHTATILFDDTQAGAWLEALEDQDHISHFYIITQSNKRFNELKQSINDMLGPLEVAEEEKRPMKDGFKANLEYFKLEFLDPNQVQLGQQFAAILPILWLMAGAKGPRPHASGHEPYLIPAANPFAVLLDETHFRPFKSAVETRADLTHIFLVTDSEDAFFDMKSDLDAPNIIMLYKSYLQNFKINTRQV